MYVLVENVMWFSWGVFAYNVFFLKGEFILPEEYKTNTIETTMK